MISEIKKELDKKPKKKSIEHWIKDYPSFLAWILQQTSDLPEQTKLSERLYIVLYGRPSCPSMIFNRFDVGYKFCGNKQQCECKKKHYEKTKEESNNKRKKTLLKRYNVEWNSQIEEVKEKKKNTCLARYGSETNLVTVENRRKQKQTNLKKYGYEHPMQNPEIARKARQTYEEKYGRDYAIQQIRKNLKDKYNVEYALKLDEFKEKAKATNLRRFGVEYPQKLKQIKEKIKKTNLERYGTVCPLQNEVIADKAKKTILERFGVDHIKKSQYWRDKVCETNLKRYGSKWSFQSEDIKYKIKKTFLYRFDRESANQQHIKKEVLDKLKDRKWLAEQNKKYPVTYIAAQLGVSSTCVYGYFAKHNLNLTYHFNSKQQMEVFEYVSSLVPNVVQNVRDIIPPFEVDIYIPDKKIAIEYCGLYWHSERSGKDRLYHVTKHSLCEQQGVRLITLFEDEWIRKQDICKKRLAHILGVSNKVCSARETEVKEIPNAEYQLFTMLRQESPVALALG